jgi:hypothetical protein
VIGDTEKEISSPSHAIPLCGLLNVGKTVEKTLPTM